MSAAHILIVEDDGVVATHLSQVLEAMGYRIAGTVATGEDAVRYARDLRPDVVLMDIRLRGAMSGIEAAREIHRGSAIPVIYLTAYADHELVGHAKTTEPYAYLTKPVRDQELQASVEIALYKSAAECRIKHLNEVLRSVRDVNQLITREQDRQRLLDDACQIIVRTRGYRLAFIWSGEFTGVQARAGEASNLLDVLASTPPDGERTLWPCGHAFAERKPVLVQDILTDASTRSWRDAALACGVASEAALPMLHAGRLHGVLCVGADRPAAFDPEELALLDELAADLALALHSIEGQTERQRAEAARQASEERFRALVEATNDWVWEVDSKGIYTYVSPRVRDLLGYEPAEVLGKTPFDFMPAVEAERVAHAFRACVEGRNPILGLENTNRHKNGSLVVLESNGVPILDAAGNLLGYRGIDRDITERKRVEENLREHRDRLSSILRAAPTGIGVVVSNRIFKDVNERVCEMTGYSRDELVEHSSRMLYPSEEEFERVGREKYEQIKAHGKTGTVETRWKRKDGTLIDVLLSSTPIHPADWFAGVTFTALDITERKQAEAAVTRRNQQFLVLSLTAQQINAVLEVPVILRRLVDAARQLTGANSGAAGLMHDGKLVFTEYDDQGRIVPIDFQFESGYGVPGWVMKTAVPYVSNDAAHDPHVIPEIQQALKFYNLIDVPILSREGEMLGCFEIHNTTDHRPFDENDVTLLKGLAASAAIALENARMLNERKRTETALRESEERFRSLFTAMREGFSLHEILCDAAGHPVDYRYLDVNPAFERFTGIPRAQWLGRTVKEVLPQIEPHWIEAFGEVALTGSSKQFENYVKELDRYYHVVAFSPAPGRFAVISSDVTERKRAEDALQAAERRLRDIVEHSTNLFYLHTPDHILQYVSPQSRTFFDCEPEEAKIRWTEFLTDNPANAVGMERTQRAIETGQPQPPYELQLRTQKGRMIWVEVHEAPVVKDGRTAAIVGSLTDITDRRQAEAALRESQYFLAKAQEVAGVGCYEFQANTGHWISTPMLDQIFGLTTDDPKDIASWLRVIHPDERAEMQRYLMEQVLQTGQRFEKEYRIVRASDGEERWVFGLGELEFDTSGRAVKMIGTIQDITDRKRAEKALQESERKYRELVENANSIILRWNPRGEITFLNEFGLAFFGYSASEILGRHVMGTLVPENESTGRDLRPLMDQICNAPRSFERNVNENIRRDGTRAWIAWTNRAVFDARGELVEVFSVGSDVTDRKQAEQEIRRLNAELEQRVADRTIQLSAANRELEAFSYSVSHDLRAPLRAINGFSQALQEDCAAQLGENGREYLDRVRAATRRMEQLIDDLLKLSRVTRASLRPSPVDLSALARTTLADLQAAHPERVVETVVGPGLQIEADPGLMRVVLDNLLGNAWKFTRDRSPGRIEVGRCEREGRPACFIRDNGVGFDMQYAGKLFGAFQRLHTTEQFEGTGIGLATVQRILHRHGSQAWAEGNLGQGATFYFTLDTVGC